MNLLVSGISCCNRQSKTDTNGSRREFFEEHLTLASTVSCAYYYVQMRANAFAIYYRLLANQSVRRSCVTTRLRNIQSCHRVGREIAFWESVWMSLIAHIGKVLEPVISKGHRMSDNIVLQLWKNMYHVLSMALNVLECPLPHKTFDEFTKLRKCESKLKITILSRDVEF